MKATRLLALYPRCWRLHYGEEISAILGDERLSVALVVDLILGAVDAHLHPELAGPILAAAAGGTLQTPRGPRRWLGPFVLILFVAGMAFCYFVLLPQAIKFLISFAGDVFENQLRASTYLSFVTMFILGMGVVFVMLAIIFALLKVGVVKRQWLTKQ